MLPTLAFDVYGTLIDTRGVLPLLQGLVGDKAQAVSETWRSKQLEYSFRRGLMGQYCGFSTCTRQALQYACSLHGAELSGPQTERLLESYAKLPPFEDVLPALDRLRRGGHRLFAFSNGSRPDLENLLGNAELLHLFSDVVSVEDQATFKPSPSVYRHLLEIVGEPAPSTWLVSSNSFDVLGALASGLNSAWIQRSPKMVFDPWGVDPTLTFPDLLELAARLPGDGQDSSLA